VLQCVVCPAPSARPPGAAAGPGAGARGGVASVFSARARDPRAGDPRARHSLCRVLRATVSPHSATTQSTQSRPCRVYSRRCRECSRSTVRTVRSRVDSPRSDMHMDMHIVGGRYYQYGVAVWVHHLYGRWRARGGFGGVRGCGGPTWRPPSPRRPCLGVATLQRGAYKTWNTSLRTSQTIVTSSPAPGAPATQGGADTAPPVSTTVQLYPTCAVERRAEIGQPGPTRPVHGQAYPDRLYCAHSLAMHRLWTKQKVSAQSMMPSVRNMVKVCCGRLSPV
jgi:hypothetical protein